MNAPDQHARGLFHKFTVSRTDGRDQPGEKHHGADYFVLDLSDDPHAIPAVAAYAESCATDYPQLAEDLRSKIASAIAATNEFVNVPETTLPNGRVVPAFRVSRYYVGRGPASLPVSTAIARPWIDVSYHEAREVCARGGYALETESQRLAIAWNVSQQDANWSGGKVGEGVLRMGLHKGSVDSAQPGNFTPPDANEARWFVLSNGECICDVAGNVYGWLFDDIQGDENGLIKGCFAPDSPTLTTAPYPNRTKGMGDTSYNGHDWSGSALIRGGCWCSESSAGAFLLYYDWPDVRNGGVGFRCTLPGL